MTSIELINTMFEDFGDLISSVRAPQMVKQAVEKDLVDQISKSAPQISDSVGSIIDKTTQVFVKRVKPGLLGRVSEQRGSVFVKDLNAFALKASESGMVSAVESPIYKRLADSLLLEMGVVLGGLGTGGLILLLIWMKEHRDRAKLR